MKFKVGFNLFKPLSEIHLISERKVCLQEITSQLPQCTSGLFLGSQAPFWPAPSPCSRRPCSGEQKGEGKKLSRGERREKTRKGRTGGRGRNKEKQEKR